MIHYLCFGDSNTWGYVPAADGERFPFEQRICGVLQDRLGSGYRVIEEALNGRMTAWDDPLNADKNALRQLPSILDSHRPLDIVSIMLGINDIKRYMRKDPVDSAGGIAKLVELIKATPCGPNGASPKIVIIAPPPYVDGAKPFGRIFEGAAETSKGFSAAYREIAESQGVHFFDASELAVPPASGDGVHIDVAGCRAIAEALAAYIARL